LVEKAKFTVPLALFLVYVGEVAEKVRIPSYR